MSRELQEPDWRRLVLPITRGNCILMLGPDAVTEKIDDGNVPLMDLFAQTLKEALPDRPEIPGGSGVARIAEIYKSQYGSWGLLSAAEDFFRTKMKLKCPLLEDLAALPFRLVINTTCGTQMEEAFGPYPWKNSNSDCYVKGGPKKEMVPSFDSPDRPLIYHLYGCTSDLESLILSENDLLDFLVSVISGNPPLPNNIKSAFTDKKHCFLFLGFGFKHWYLRILLHVLSIGRGENTSFALEKFDTSHDASSVETTKLFFQEGHKIHFFDMPLDEFVSSLRKRVEDKLKDQAQGREIELPGEAPKVFVCHAKEDKERYAKDLHDRLQKEGIEAWLDVNDIPGGVDWNRDIESAIQKRMNYFVVLQTEALTGKLEGYVNKEINLALERAKQFQQGISFIIPVLVEKCDEREDLAHFQYIDLTKQDGFPKLVKRIQRDYQLRTKRT